MLMNGRIRTRTRESRMAPKPKVSFSERTADAFRLTVESRTRKQDVLTEEVTALRTEFEKHGIRFGNVEGVESGYYIIPSLDKKLHIKMDFDGGPRMRLFITTAHDMGIKKMRRPFSRAESSVVSEILKARYGIDFAVHEPTRRQKTPTPRDKDEKSCAFQKIVQAQTDFIY